MNQINTEHLDNFKSVAVALKFTVDGLQDFIHGNLQSLHQSIYRKCSAGQCMVNCSRRYGNAFSRWCTSCSTWKKELHQFNRYRKHWDNIKWNKLDTIDFPRSHEEVAKVFVQDFTHVRQGVLKDLSAIMSLFRNLKIFSCIINDTLIADIQRLRNFYFAHNYDASLHDVEKTQCFNCFIALLKIQDIECTQSSKAALNIMEEMKTSRTIPERILLDPDVQYTIAVIQNVERGETFDNAMANERPSEYLYNKQTPRRNLKTHVLRVMPLLMTFVFGMCIMLYGLLSKNEGPNLGCLSVRFGDYWKSDLDFDSYVHEKSNEGVIERSWILQKIETNNDTKRKGILLSSDMGFGKTTLVSNIVCADQNSIWYSLRQQILVYHMCRHDLILSSKPEVFIRNLAGAIVREIPEIGNAILSDDMALDFLYGKCSIDPIACLEFSVLNKLNQIKNDHSHLIIIDAIDECETSGGVDLVGLLYKKISFFPDNFQFLITSRNIERLLNKFKELEHIDLQLYEKNNLQDMRLYLQNANEMTNEEIVKLTEISGRNFLHVKLYLHYCKDLSCCDSIPDSLEKIYMLNFERVFGEKGVLFEEFISVFEVLCSLQKQIDENKLFEVAGLKSKEIKRKASRILGNELRHFIKISNGYISFQHKSISDFLTNTSRKHLNFYVDLQNGHKLFAKYLLNGLDVSKTDNLVETVHHAAMAREPEYENILLEFVRKSKNNRIVSNFTYLDLAAKDLNGYQSLQLLIKLIIPTRLQKLTLNNPWIKIKLSEAAFIAAQYGNEQSLFALLDYGSDIMYTHHGNSPKFTMDENERIKCQFQSFCGYSMLHIAAQRGYMKIVKELLYRNMTLLYKHNTMEMNAFHLAAENGHVHVLKFFLNINSSLADSYSLYLGSRNGHKKVVILLLNYVEEHCLSCTVNFSGRTIIEPGEEQEDGTTIVSFAVSMSENQVLKFIEDFRYITCDTSINAAVRNGHIEIVRILVEKSARTVNCSIYDGSIPLFTAIKYNRNEIFKLLYDISDLSHKCKGIHIDQSMLRGSEEQTLDSMKCPDHAGLEHLLAIHDNLQLIEYVFKKGHRNWDSTDKEGCSPFHHAFCHGSLKFVNFFIFEKRLPSNLLARSVNGSTPFHSAAACQSFILNLYSQKRNETIVPNIPDVFDNQGLSILQYGLNKSVSADDLIRINTLGRDDFTFSLFLVVISYNHNLLHTDKQKNNFLHYASKAGNNWVFTLIRDLDIFKDKLHLLLNQRNQQNRTPLEVAFDSLSRRKSFEAIKIPDNCSLSDVFFVKCKANFSVLLSPHEYFILTVFQYFYKKENVSEIKISELLEISVRKSRIYPILIMKVYAEREFQYTLERSVKIPMVLSESNSPYITELLLNAENALRCDGQRSALHEIVHNDRNIQWTFHSLSFLQPIFKKYSAKFLDECFDDRGYNLLHRSIMGAHLNTILYFINQGMNIWQPSKNNQTCLEISIFNSPYTDNGDIPTYYTRGSRFHSIQYVSSGDNKGVRVDSSRLISFDETASFLLDKMTQTDENKRKFIRNQLCDSKNIHFGLIHFAAAKGLFKFLKSARGIYGLDYLRCEDKFGVTPLYLAHIYSQTKIVRWMRKLKLHMKRPANSAENILLFNIIDNYKSLDDYDWTCLLRYRSKYAVLIRIQILKCSFKTKHSSIHQPWPFINSTYVKFQVLCSLIGYLVDLTSYPIDVDILHLSDFNKMENIPSELKTLMNKLRLRLSIIQRCVKMLEKKTYDMMRKFMLFGADDKYFYYRRLLSSVKMKSSSLGENKKFNVSKLLFGVYDTNYSHFRRLQMRSELHSFWLKQNQIQSTDDLQMFFKYQTKYFRTLDDMLLASKKCVSKD